MPTSTGPIQLTGTILNPDGTPANGFFVLKLNTYASVLPVAGGYKAILPNRPIVVPVVTGQVQSPSPGIYGNDVLQGATWYIVRYFDNNNPIPLFTINAYIIGSGVFDMGTLQAVEVDYPTILSLAQYIASLSSSLAIGVGTLSPIANNTTQMTGPSAFAAVFRNGLFQAPGVDYTVANGVYTFAIPFTADAQEQVWALTFDTSTSQVVSSLQMRDVSTGQIVTVTMDGGNFHYGTQV